MRNTLSRLAVGLTVLGLAACTQPASDVAPVTAAAPAAPAAEAAAAAAVPPGATTPPAHVSQAWNCDGKPVAADYDTVKQQVRLQVGAEVLTLPEAVSGSGSRYADPAGNEFWEHQGQATLTLAGGKAQTCTKAGATAG